MTGLYGKLPSYGDFIRRELPASFVQPWDEWLQGSLAAARLLTQDRFESLWAQAPAWRFRLRAGACGDEAVAGVLITSQDAVGREFPLTLAAVLGFDTPVPDAAWYAEVEEVALRARNESLTAEAVLAMLPGLPEATTLPPGEAGPPAEGWWSGNGQRWPFTGLPPFAHFRLLLQDQASAAAGLDGASDAHADTGAGPGTDEVATPRAAAGPSSAAATHQGTVRKRNEDAFVERADIGLWAVADGAGGHGAGDVASTAVATALADLPPGLSGGEVLAQVRLRLGAVHAELQRMDTGQAGQNLAATTAVVLLSRDDHFACLWVGDSRAYLLRDAELTQLTRDHSLVQELVETGALAPEDAESHPQANVITRAIGAPDSLQLDKVAGRLQPGDLLLLCTDGLFKALPEARIAELLRGGAQAQQLLDAALLAGARDNVTAVVVRF